MSKKLITIYGLLNPIDKNIFYIGATNNISRRLYSHIFESKRRASYKENTIADILQSGLKPVLLELEDCLPEDVVFTENFYINLFAFYGFKINQSKTSVYGSVSQRPMLKEKFKSWKRYNSVFCTMTFDVGGYCTVLKAKFEPQSYSEGTAKKEMRVWYGELKENNKVHEQ